MLAMMKQLKWHHLLVVHDTDAYNTCLTHLLMQLAAANDDICISSSMQYAYAERVNHGVGEDIKNSNQNIVQSLLSGNNYGIPILILMQQTSIQNFVESLKDYINPNNTSPLQLFFSNLLTHGDVRFMPKQVAKIYSLSIQSDQLHSFEEYWQDRLRHMKVNEHLLFQLIDFFFIVLLILKHYGHPVINITFLDHYISLHPKQICIYTSPYFSPKNQ